jgi:hypothetical protein
VNDVSKCVLAVGVSIWPNQLLSENSHGGDFSARWKTRKNTSGHRNRVDIEVRGHGQRRRSEGLVGPPGVEVASEARPSFSLTPSPVFLSQQPSSLLCYLELNPHVQSKTLLPSGNA